MPDSPPVPDYFALLNEPRRPWLNPEEVQAKFLKLSAECHPDRIHNAPADEKVRATGQFSDLNIAANCLRDPKARLAHLLELENGSRPAALEQLRSSATDFYFRVGALCRKVDQFLNERARAVSPLLKLGLFEQTMDWTEKLQQLQGELSQRQGALQEKLKSLNAAWEQAPPIGSPERTATLPLSETEEIYREWGYVQRWADEVQEKVVLLSI